MRIGLLAALALLPHASVGHAQAADGWYTMNTVAERCIRAEEGPAGVIRSMMALGGRYSVEEETDQRSGQITKVRITLPDLGRDVIFFRGDHRCQAALDAILSVRRAQQQQIEERYRIDPAPPNTGGGPQQGSVSPAGRTTLTQGEIRGLADQISECWNVDRGMLGLDPIVVELRVQLDSQGVVRNVVPNGAPPSDPRARSIYEAARRALMSPQCNPLRVPPSRYGTIMASVFRFNQRGLIR